MSQGAPGFHIQLQNVIGGSGSSECQCLIAGWICQYFCATGVNLQHLSLNVRRINTMF